MYIFVICIILYLLNTRKKNHSNRIWTSSFIIIIHYDHCFAPVFVALFVILFVVCIFCFIFLSRLYRLSPMCMLHFSTHIHTHTLTHSPRTDLVRFTSTLRLADATLHSFMLLAVCLVIICSFFSSFFCFPSLVTVYVLLLISDHPRWINHIPFCLVCGW